ncbi:MAG: hypothetical protein IJ386_04000 [Clostridia bacterium]|nr:hypothetical protein [Clostridia bacterium]
MGKWFKRIIKAIVILLCLLLVWRVWLLEDDSILGDFIPTESSAEIYKTNGSITVMTNDVVHEMSEGGYFSVYGMYYTPETKELQVTVRCNLNSVEPLGDIRFFAYTVDTSVDPVEAVTDESGEATEGVRLHEGYPIKEVFMSENHGHEERLFYSYDKLVFEGVEIGENINLIISLCTGDSIDSEVAVIAAHFAEQPMKEHKLSKGEREALSAFGE